MKNANFVICIPSHKASLSRIEKKNVEITLKKNYDTEIYFILPKGININFYSLNFPKIKIKFFDKFFFKNEIAYNRFVLSHFFYEKFKKFKFLVICQTDAQIIKNINKLKNINYDYIGSPWRPEKKINILDIYGIGFLNKFFKFKKKKLLVGNGGLSIRRVSKFIKFTKKIRFIKFINCGEDIFISYFAKKFNINIANFYTSNNIFRENTSKLTKNNNNLVYGYHALKKFNPILDKSLSNFL